MRIFLTRHFEVRVYKIVSLGIPSLCREQGPGNCLATFPTGMYGERDDRMFAATSAIHKRPQRDEIGGQPVEAKLAGLRETFLVQNQDRKPVSL